MFSQGVVLRQAGPRGSTLPCHARVGLNGALLPCTDLRTIAFLPFGTRLVVGPRLPVRQRIPSLGAVKRIQTMNHLFRTIWSQAKATWVVVAETGVSGRGRHGSRSRRRGDVPWLRLQPGSAVALLLAMGLSLPAHALLRYWDPNGTAANRGGDGIWNNAAHWSLNGDGITGPHIAWDNALFDDAVLGGTRGTVTLTAPITLRHLTFETLGYVLQGDTLTLGGLTPTITSNVSSAVINSVIAGNAGLTKNGSGSLTLNGLSTYTGQTIFNPTASTSALSFNSIGNVGGGPSALGAPTSAATGTLLINSPNSSTNPALTYTGSGHSSDRDWTLTGPQGGAFRLRNQGSGPLTLSGAIRINATGTNTILFEANRSDLALLGVISSATPHSVGFTGDAGRTIILGGSNTYTGTTSISGARTQASVLGNQLSISSLGTGAGSTAVINVNSNGILEYTGVGNTTNRPWIWNAGSLINNGSGALTLTGNVALNGLGTLGGTFSGASNTVSGVIAGSGALAVNTAGTWTLSGTNGYTGTTTINGGTLRAGAAAGGQAFGLNSAMTLANGAGATLDLNGFDQTVGSLAGGGSLGGAVLLGSGTLNTGNNNTSTTYAGTLTGSGGLLKSGSGTQTLSGSGSLGSTRLAGGALAVSGQYDSHQLVLGDGTQLTVDGTLQGHAGSQAALSGSAGVNSIRIGTEGVLRAIGDLGDGADLLDVQGELDARGGELSLGDGDDTLSIHDATQILGTVDAGSGTDTLHTHLLGAATAGALQGFETLSKTGAGVLNFVGPDRSDFTTVNVLEGRVHVHSGATVDPLSTQVAAGARLSVDGTYLGTQGDDTFVVNGTLDGQGLIQLLEGNDVLTLQDSSDISGLAQAIDGGALSTADTVVLDSAASLVTDLGKTVNFETLRKLGAGTALAQGNGQFSRIQLDAGHLNLRGQSSAADVTLQDGTDLTVEGLLQASGALTTNLTGSTGENAVHIAATGLLRATGDLGAGNDILDVAGTLDAHGGVFSLGDGDDTLVVHEGTTILGTVSGGAGLDTRAYDFSGDAHIGALTDFEGLGKRGTGTLHLTGPTSELANVWVEGGTLDIGHGSTVVAQAGSSLGAQIRDGGTLNIDGQWASSTQADTFEVAGRLTGSGALSLGDGDDTLVLHDSADLSGWLAPLNGGAHIHGDTVALNSATAMVLDDHLALADFEALRKDNTGTATLVGSHVYSGGTTVNNGVLDVDGRLTTSTIAMTNSSGTSTLNVDGVVEAAGAGPLLLSGSTARNVVRVASGATLHASGDLGGGDDVLDVAGTLNAGGGSFSLNDGDDTLVLHDGTQILGTVQGGDGFDTRAYDLTGTASVNALSQFEGLAKRGSGRLNLNGPAASELAGVVVEEGVLNIAPGASVVAQAGSPLDTQVLNGATLHVDGRYGCGASNDSLSLSGRLTGSGGVDLCAGDDALILGDGADITGFSGLIDGGGQTVAGDTLVLNNAATQSVAATHLSGFEVLHKVNTGTAMLLGQHQYGLRTQVDAGRLNVAGSLTSPTVTIAAAGALVGSGRIIGDVHNQGRIAPGNSIGTLSVSGDVTFVPGSTYGVEIEPGGAADLLAVDGAVAIQGGTLEVTAAPGSYDPGVRWSILTASQGVSGTFSDSVFNMPFLALGIGYEPNSVFLEVQRNDTSFSQLAQTSNQMNVAQGLDSMAPEAALPQAVASLPSATQAQQTYNLLSGEIHSTLYGTLLQDSRFVREATLRRGCTAQDERQEKQRGKALDLSSCAPLAEHRDGDFTLWTQVFESRGTIDGHDQGDVAPTDRRINGLFIGADVPVGEDWRAGWVSGYERTDVDVNRRQSSAQIDTYHLGLYTNGPIGVFEARGGLVHSLSRVDSRRDLLLSGVNQNLKADYDVNTSQVFVELSQRQRFAAVQVEPFANLTWVHQDGEAINEKGGDAALHSQAQTEDLGYATLGLRAATKIAQTQQATYLATGSLGWQRLLNGYTPQRTQRFAGSNAFDIDGAPLARDSLPVEAGLAVVFNAQGMLSVGYRGQWSDAGEDHGASVSLSVAF